MAFPSTNSTNTLDAALRQAMGIAGDIKAKAQNLANAAASGLGGDQIVWWPIYLTTQNNLLTQCASVSGIGAYAQAQLGNATFDIVGAFTTMQAAIVSTIAWISTNFPKDVNGNLLYVQYGSGVFTYTQFTPGQLSGLVSALNALIATIN